MRGGCRGFTMVEMVMSLALTGSLLGLVWGSLTIGQMGFNTSEAVLLVDDSARHVMMAIKNDLERSQILSYWDGQAAGQGNGKVYVKFRRMDPATTAAVTAAGQPAWDAQERMYLWCPLGAAGPAYSSWNVCALLDDMDGVTPYTPGPRQLLLLRAAAANPNGEIHRRWVLERVVSGNLQNPAVAAGAGTDTLRGLAISLTNVDGSNTAIRMPNALDCPSSHSIEEQELCVNRNGNAFNVGAYDAANRLRLRLTATVRTREVTPFGRVVRAQAIRESILLKNPQDLP